MKKLPQEMTKYIEKMRLDPYNVFSNNCIDKTQKLAAKAKSLGLSYKVISCTSQYPEGTSSLSLNGMITPHVYIVVEGHKVDVAEDPETEKWRKENLGEAEILSETVIGEWKAY